MINPLNRKPVPAAALVAANNLFIPAAPGKKNDYSALNDLPNIFNFNKQLKKEEPGKTSSILGPILLASKLFGKGGGIGSIFCNKQCQERKDMEAQALLNQSNALINVSSGQEDKSIIAPFIIGGLAIFVVGITYAIVKSI